MFLLVVVLVAGCGPRLDREGGRRADGGEAAATTGEAQHRADTAPEQQTAQSPQDLWIVSPQRLIEGDAGAGRHTTLPPSVDAVRISPDGERALLLLADTTRMRTTYAHWVELIHLAAGERRRLAVQSEWWTVADWLPDGRIVLLGDKVWLSDKTGNTLEDLGSAGYPLGGAFDRRTRVAWTSPIQTSTGGNGSLYRITVLNLETREQTDYPGPYHKSVNPKSGAPLLFDPNGEHLAFIDRSEDGARVLALTLKTGDQRLVTSGQAYPYFWDQRGLWVWRTAESSSTTGTLARLDDQGHETQVISVPYPIPYVSPDDRWLPVGRDDEKAIPQPGLLELSSGTIHWANATDYRAVGWTPTNELVLIHTPRR